MNIGCKLYDELGNKRIFINTFIHVSDDAASTFFK